MNECRKSIPTLELLQESPIPSMPIKGHPPEYEHMQSALKRRKALSFLTNQHISKFTNISTRVNAKMKIKHLLNPYRSLPKNTCGTIILMMSIWFVLVFMVENSKSLSLGNKVDRLFPT